VPQGAAGEGSCSTHARQVAHATPHRSDVLRWRPCARQRQIWWRQCRLRGAMEAYGPLPHGRPWSDPRPGSRERPCLCARHRHSSPMTRSGTRTRSSTTPVRAFFDSDGNGSGDFPGLTSRLDYIQDLGVNAVWLLPFYPSPMRDDGYDISDYRNVHPDFGTRRDFRLFVRAAHRRGIRVITELVINHTPTSIPGSRPRGGRRRGHASATTTSGATTTGNSPRRGSSSPTPRRRTGPGTRSRRPTIGTGSSPTSLTSTTTTPRW
jgi:hypothetical protein